MAELTEEDLLSMSDEEFEALQANTDELAENNVSSENTEEVVNNFDENQEEEIQKEDNTEASEETEEVSEASEEEETEESNDNIETETGSESTEEVTETEESPSEGDLDYKKTYEEIMKPIKVSGKEVVVKDINDLRNLASMGIDYSRKMRDIKPLRAVGETLKQAGILGNDGSIDQQALTRLIDINNGNKEAIAELLKEKNIDPLDMNIDEVNYIPESKVVTEHEVEIREVENQLASRGTIDVVVSKLSELDPQSKQYFQESPTDLLKLEQDISTGVYDEIMGVVQYEKSLGRLTGISDIEAYIQVARAKSAQEAQKPNPVNPQPVNKEPSKAKRKAAGISKRPPANKVKKTYDFINMSDEEFEKLVPKTGLY